MRRDRLSDLSETVTRLTPDRRRQTVSLLIVALLIATIVTQIVGYFYIASRDDVLQSLRSETDYARSTQQSLYEAERNVGAFLSSGEEADLRLYHQALGRIEHAARAGSGTGAGADEASPASGAGDRPTLLTARQVDGIVLRWEEAIRLKRAAKESQAAGRRRPPHSLDGPARPRIGPHSAPRPCLSCRSHRLRGALLQGRGRPVLRHEPDRRHGNRRLRDRNRSDRGGTVRTNRSPPGPGR